MANTIKAAIIGCGGIGRTHADCIRQIEGIEAVAYCDIYEEAARKLYNEFGGKYYTTDADRIFADDGIDAVYICTHHDTHAPFAIKAARAGKHILVEKPLALTIEECEKVGEAVEKSGVKMMTAFKMRYYAMVQKAKELIPKPVLIVGQMTDNFWKEEHWANDPVEGGGNVLSQGCHMVDIICYMAGGRPVRVFAEGDCYYHPARKVIDNVVATISFDNGCVASWIQGDANLPTYASKFFMETFVKDKHCTLTDRFTRLMYAEGGKAQEFKGVETGFLEENRGFVECIRNNTKPPIDHIDGLRATLIVLKAFEAIKTRRPQEITV